MARREMICQCLGSLGMGVGKIFFPFNLGQFPILIRFQQSAKNFGSVDL